MGEFVWQNKILFLVMYVKGETKSWYLKKFINIFNKIMTKNVIYQTTQFHTISTSFNDSGSTFVLWSMCICTEHETKHWPFVFPSERVFWPQTNASLLLWNVVMVLFVRNSSSLIINKNRSPTTWIWQQKCPCSFCFPHKS